MTSKFNARFTDGAGKTFTVTEVVQTPVGLTVYFENEKTKEQSSCLIDTFTERYKELV